MNKLSNSKFGVQKNRLVTHGIAPFWLLTLLSACGGGRSGTEGSVGSSDAGSSGYVFDGYISGARVYRDGNGNNRYDLGENFTNTNSTGFLATCWVAKRRQL